MDNCRFGAWVFLVLFCLVCTICNVYLYWYLPETKGLSRSGFRFERDIQDAPLPMSLTKFERSSVRKLLTGKLVHLDGAVFIS